MKKNITITFLALGTVNSISVTDYNNKAAVENAVKRVQALHQRLSAFNDDSDIYAVNEAAGRQFVKVHWDTLKLVEEAKFYAELTGGAFDPTVRPLVTAWNIGSQKSSIPEAGEISKALRLTNYKDIMIDHQNSSLMLRRSNMALDLGGIAKGFAADEVRRILQEDGITDAIINLGGTVSVLGGPKTVGVQHPDMQTGRAMGHISLSEQIAVTSGSYEKFFINTGKRYHHLLDPHTGYPADSGLKSVTLIGASALELDALSTAIFVLGGEKSREMVEKLRLQAIYITTENQIFVTPGLRGAVTLLQNSEVQHG